MYLLLNSYLLRGIVLMKLPKAFYGPFCNDYYGSEVYKKL